MTLLRLLLAGLLASCGGEPGAGERGSSSGEVHAGETGSAVTTGLGSTGASEGLSGAPSMTSSSAAAASSSAGEAVASRDAKSAATVGPESPPEGMVAIEPGLALIGGEGPENSPRHMTAMAGYFLDAKEVTVRQYRPCVAAGLCKEMQKNNPFCNIHFTDRDDHPANCIDWNDADAYCKFVGKRLPTEHEWEYAAKGGAAGNLYSWGSEEPDRTRSCYMHQGGSCAVGSFAPNVFGLYDMTGNVWEWTSSWYAPFPDEAANGIAKVYRGGSWSRRFAKWMRNDLRNRFPVDQQSASIGMRCAKSPSLIRCPEGSRLEDRVCVIDEPDCPAGQERVGASCVVAAQGKSPARRSSSSAAVTQPKSKASADLTSDAESATPTRSRAPNFDHDCELHYSKTPIAYTWSGGTFHAREPLIRGAGCIKRDVGRGWSSACCPQ